MSVFYGLVHCRGGVSPPETNAPPTPLPLYLSLIYITPSFQNAQMKPTLFVHFATDAHNGYKMGRNIIENSGKTTQKFTNMNEKKTSIFGKKE